jgi:hypothetical protein
MFIGFNILCIQQTAKSIKNRVELFAKRHFILIFHFFLIMFFNLSTGM